MLKESNQHCVGYSIFLLSFSALFCALRALLSDFKFNLLSWRHQQDSSLRKDRQIEVFYSLPLAVLIPGCGWDCLPLSAALMRLPFLLWLQPPLVVLFSFPCSFRIKGVMTSHCYWSLGAYKCASILMCGGFPHITKQFCYTSWVS